LAADIEESVISPLARGVVVPEFHVDFLESYDKNAILEELRRISTRTRRQTVTKADIEKHGRLSYEVINRRFGSLRKALQEAGLEPSRFMKGGNEELLEILVQLWTRTLETEGRRPYRKDLKEYGFPVSSDTYTRQFGSWKKALLRAYNFVSTGEQPEDGSVGRNPTDLGCSADASRGSISIRKRFQVF
jgi:Homing endonuclease associated repeat